jgi:hypothetical protein
MIATKPRQPVGKENQLQNMMLALRLDAEDAQKKGGS